MANLDKYGVKMPDQRPVFGRGTQRSINGESRAGFATTGNSINFRRDNKDNTPARDNSTAKLMGDPRPGQFNLEPRWRPGDL